MTSSGERAGKEGRVNMINVGFDFGKLSDFARGIGLYLACINTP